jgi:23S rRNA C2498 (ribose-2'-O)-methylase RlmM
VLWANVGDATNNIAALRPAVRRRRLERGMVALDLRALPAGWFLHMRTHSVSIAANAAEVMHDD